MTDIAHSVYSGVVCDKRACPAEIRGEELPHFVGRRTYEQRAVEAGWSIWVGRSRRHYCPNHGPAKPQTMRCVTEET